MDDSYLKLASQAESLCVGIAGHIVELEAVKAAIALEDKQQAGGSVPAATSTPVRQEKQVTVPVTVLDVTEVPLVAVEAVALVEVVLAAVPPVQVVVAAGTRTRARSVGRRDDDSLEFEEFGTVSEDEDAGSLNSSNVEAMLKRSIRSSTEAKYVSKYSRTLFSNILILCTISYSQIKLCSQ
jgi:hypothetical protein